MTKRFFVLSIEEIVFNGSDCYCIGISTGALNTCRYIQKDEMAEFKFVDWFRGEIDYVKPKDVLITCRSKENNLIKLAKYFGQVHNVGVRFYSPWRVKDFGFDFNKEDNTECILRLSEDYTVDVRDNNAILATCLYYQFYKRRSKIEWRKSIKAPKLKKD